MSMQRAGCKRARCSSIPGPRRHLKSADGSTLVRRLKRRSWATEGPVPRGRRAVRPDSDAITPGGPRSHLRSAFGGLRRRGVEPGPSSRRAEASVVSCCAVWGSRRSPLGVALAPGARAESRGARSERSGDPCAGCYRHGTVNGEGLCGGRGRSVISTARGAASGYRFVVSCACART